jgi:signal peptidase I
MSKLVGGVILLIVGALVAFRMFIVNVSVVPQNGMYPTIPGGSLVFSWKRPYGGITAVERGDIVLFNRIQQGQTYLYVWRVVGLPGDKVLAAKDTLSLNGSPLKRELLRDEGGLTIFRETAGVTSYEIAIAKEPREIPPDVDVTVGPDELFVVGDNRYNAVDSRYFGPIKFSTVVGRKL